jgi:carboxyl-terminal processing protease
MSAPRNLSSSDRSDPADQSITGSPIEAAIDHADVGSVEPVDGVEARPSGRSRRPRTINASRFGVFIVVVLVGSALFLGGYSLGARVATTPGTPASAESQFAPFWDVISLIQSDYAGSPRPTQDDLIRAAIKGMMESLNDPWSYYQQPDDFQNSLLDVGGQAQGIGVQVQLQPVQAGSTLACPAIGNGCELAIVQPIPGSPAALAGIQAGDVIVAVGGASLDGLTLDQVTAKIKGPTGTSVTLAIQRGTKTIDVTITRNIYNQPEVDTKVLANGAVEYMHVSGINGAASSQFELALTGALAAGRKAIVLDLRGNLGGYVPDAVKIASEFIPSGPILYQQDASGAQTEIAADPAGLATDLSVKVVVLVDGNTASAAEITAAALQSHGRALLVGEKTYGKGVVQEWLPLPNNDGGVHLTVARWLTPNGVWIQGKGLAPDIAATNSGARAGTDPVLDAGLTALGYPPQPGAAPSPAASPSAPSVPSLLPSPSPS